MAQYHSENVSCGRVLDFEDINRDRYSIDCECIWSMRVSPVDRGIDDRYHLNMKWIPELVTDNENGIRFCFSRKEYADKIVDQWIRYKNSCIDNYKVWKVDCGGMKYGK